jgi:GTPase SAR1 family protein
MGCTVSKKPVSPLNEADKLLQESKEEEKFNFKILLLGAGESGKSTVVKQIRIVYNVQPTKEEVRQTVSALQRNCIEAIQTLITASKTLGIPLSDEGLTMSAEKLMALDQNCRVNPEYAELISQVWQDPGIQRTYDRRHEYWIMDATAYYLNEVARISQQEFEPNDEDLIMARIRTTGIVISEVAEKPYRFQIVDVGGQRSERRKWIHCFDDVKAIIYLASLSGYNQILFEDSSENIMHESLKLFEEVAKNPLFKHTPIFCFLNKKDLFEEYIKIHPLKKCFPDYNGPEGEMNPALDYIQNKFRKIMDDAVPGKQVPISIIAARVRRDMKLAFGEVKDSLKKPGFTLNTDAKGKSRKVNSVQPAAGTSVHKSAHS